MALRVENLAPFPQAISAGMLETANALHKRTSTHSRAVNLVRLHFRNRFFIPHAVFPYRSVTAATAKLFRVT